MSLLLLLTRPSLIKRIPIMHDDLTPYDNFDRTVTISFRPQGLSRGVIPLLYAEARTGLPISYLAASEILAHRGSHVGILTGASVPGFLPNGENDGPLGAIVLGNALHALGYKVSFLTEAELTPMFRGMFDLFQQGFPIIELAHHDAEDHAGTAPGLEVLVSIEKLGSNRKHVMHGATGTSRNGTRAHVDGLVERMNTAGKLTIGIGDGGNEIGFGKIFDAARKLVDHGTKCRCPCEDGVVTKTATQYLYPVAVSNWGAYAVTAALGALTGDSSIIHTPKKEIELVKLATRLDCRDGGSGRALDAVDGVPIETTSAVVQILQTLAETVHEKVSREF
jgi:D-glutamate cyclase